MNTAPDFLRDLAHTAGWDEPEEEDFLARLSSARRPPCCVDKVEIETTYEIAQQLSLLSREPLELANYTCTLRWSSGTPDRERVHKSEINYLATVEIVEIIEIADTPVSSYVATLRITTHWEAL